MPSYLGRVRFLRLEKTPSWICLSKFLETEPVSLMGTFICVRDKLPSQGERGPLNGVCTVHAETRGQSTCTGLECAAGEGRGLWTMGAACSRPPEQWLPCSQSLVTLRAQQGSPKGTVLQQCERRSEVWLY